MVHYVSDPLLKHYVAGARARECEDSFLREVVVPLLGSASSMVHLPARVRLKSSFMEAIRKAVEPSRPQKRRETTIIDIQEQDAFIMTDLSLLLTPDCGLAHRPMLGVELKPKWGFLPSSPFLPEQDVKRRVCRFCMQQSLKLKKGQVHHKSQYCPLDLYSHVRSPFRYATRPLAAIDTRPNAT